MVEFYSWAKLLSPLFLVLHVIDVTTLIPRRWARGFAGLTIKSVGRPQ